MSKNAKPPKGQPKLHVEDDEDAGRKLFGWLERPGAVFYVIVALGAVAIISLAIDAMRSPTPGGIDSLWGFYALAGAFGLTAFVLLARLLEFLLARAPDYYEADDDRP